MDSVGALPYPSPELHSAWPIPIRQRPCHEQKSHCDQACIQLPMSLLALAAPAAWLFEQGWDFSLQSAEEESDECGWYSAGWRVWMTGAVRVQGYLDTDPDWEEAQTGCSFLKRPLYVEQIWVFVLGWFQVEPFSGKWSSWISTEQLSDFRVNMIIVGLHLLINLMIFFSWLIESLFGQVLQGLNCQTHRLRLL